MEYICGNSFQGKRKFMFLSIQVVDSYDRKRRAQTEKKIQTIWKGNGRNGHTLPFDHELRETGHLIIT